MMNDIERAFKTYNVNTIEDLIAEVRNRTINECFDVIGNQVVTVFTAQTAERHANNLSAYRQECDCFSCGTLEYDILHESKKQLMSNEV